MSHLNFLYIWFNMGNYTNAKEKNQLHKKKNSKMKI